ncbi:hypothetical protein [Paramagnetospirillum caucaseum]|uniref:hypothetical protein n=1 Tax=Paramagnetospirillum caucaseum TaxID=1244869 RepID=UPI00126784D8|nr:hypothetical protein [Paramagnetospirillum caucaseum]
MSRLTFALSLFLRQTGWGIALVCIVQAAVETQWLWLLAAAIAWFICQALALLVACVKLNAGAAAEPPPAAGS